METFFWFFSSICIDFQWKYFVLFFFLAKKALVREINANQKRILKKQVSSESGTVHGAESARCR